MATGIIHRNNNFNTTLVKVHLSLINAGTLKAEHFNTTLVKVHHKCAMYGDTILKFQYNPC